jgi:hypothetical protein
MRKIALATLATLVSLSFAALGLFAIGYLAAGFVRFFTGYVCC